MRYVVGFVLLLCCQCGYSQKGKLKFVVNPYLQVGYNPSQSSLKLLWQTENLGANWIVEYKSEKKSDWIKSITPEFKIINISGTPVHRLYETEFTNLIPGEMFSYRVIKNDSIVFISQAHAAKAKNQDQNFIVFGDIGAGSTDAINIAKGVYNAKADIAFIPGDIVYDNGLIREYNRRFWPIYNADTSNEYGFPIMSKIPFVAAVGNHDADTRNLNKYPDALAYYYYWQQPLNGPLFQEGTNVLPALIASDENRRAFLDAAGEAYPRMTNFSYDYGNAHWLVIDADVYMDWTDKELLDWVKSDLEKAKNAEWKFVLFHQPGFNSSKEHYEEQQMRLLSPIFEAGKVDVVFAGHVHNYQRSYPLTFKPNNQGVQLVNNDNKTPAGKIVIGEWRLDKEYNGSSNTHPNGVIYIITGAGGQDLYNQEQQADTDSWQKFTCKFISQYHTFTQANINNKILTIRQLNAEGKEVDKFIITH